MRELLLKQVDVFTTRAFSGFPAMVVTGAEGLSSAEMQRVAAENYTLETTFVTEPESAEADFRVNFFTPSKPYNYSGHAMVGTCHALAEEGIVDLAGGVTTCRMETRAGIIRVDYHSREKSPSSSRFRDPDSVELALNGSVKELNKIMIHRAIRDFEPAEIQVNEIASILGLDPDEITKTGLPVKIVYSGLYQLVIPVLHKKALTGMHPDLIKLKLMNMKFGVNTTDIFTLEPVHDECVTYSRHFSPAMGMWEDYGSGAGASSIAAYLLKFGVVSPKSMVMEQGRELDRLSRVQIALEENSDGSVAVQVGGLAVTSMTRRAVISEDSVSVT